MRRHRSRTQSNLAGGFLIVLSVIVAAGIFVYVYLNQTLSVRPGPVQPDRDHLVCWPLLLMPRISLVRLRDSRSRTRSWQASMSLSPESRIELWSVAPTSGVPVRVGPVFCRPPRAVDVSAVTGNPQLAEIAEQKFQAASLARRSSLCLVRRRATLPQLWRPSRP